MIKVVFAVCAIFFILVVQLGNRKKIWTPQRLFWLPAVCFIPFNVAVIIQAIIEKNLKLIIPGMVVAELVLVSIGFVFSKHMQQEPWRSKYHVRVPDPKRGRSKK